MTSSGWHGTPGCEVFSTVPSCLFSPSANIHTLPGTHLRLSRVRKLGSGQILQHFPLMLLTIWNLIVAQGTNYCNTVAITQMSQQTLNTVLFFCMLCYLCFHVLLCLVAILCSIVSLLRCVGVWHGMSCFHFRLCRMSCYFLFNICIVYLV